MTEKDFVYAWLLVARVGKDDHWTQIKGLHLIDNAKEIYKLIQQECKDETDSRTED